MHEFSSIVWLRKNEFCDRKLSHGPLVLQPLWLMLADWTINPNKKHIFFQVGKNDGQQRHYTPTYKWHLKKSHPYAGKRRIPPMVAYSPPTMKFFVQIPVHLGWKVHSHRWNLTLPDRRMTFFKRHLYVCAPPNIWLLANEMVANYVHMNTNLCLAVITFTNLLAKWSSFERKTRRFVDKSVEIQQCPSERKIPLESEKVHVSWGMCEHLGRTCLLTVSVVLGY